MIVYIGTYWHGVHSLSTPPLHLQTSAPFASTFYIETGAANAESVCGSFCGGIVNSHIVQNLDLSCRLGLVAAIYTSLDLNNLTKVGNLDSIVAHSGSA